MLAAIPHLSSFKINETKFIQIISANSFVKKINCKQQHIFVYKTIFKHLHFLFTSSNKNATIWGILYKYDLICIKTQFF